MKRITVVGAGYVGLSLATLLAKNNEVVISEIIEDKVDKINRRIPPIKDDKIEEYFNEIPLNLIATTNKKKAYQHGVDFIIIATPTNYNEDTQYFDTTSIEEVVKEIIEVNNTANIVIKSTVPIGYIKKLREEMNYDRIYFSPEFLREGNALRDNIYPSRIIVGINKDIQEEVKFANMFINELINCSSGGDIHTLVTDLTESEAIKLFANTYLAMRVAYFNEVDTYAASLGLNSKDIILGVSYDPRIGNNYNNPSFGYGGYCFPKDTKQLVANYKENNIANSLIDATVRSNMIRILFIAKQIEERIKDINNPVIGIYKVAMKSGSDNSRSSAMIEVIKKLKNINNITFLLYDNIPLTQELKDLGITKVATIEDLNEADLIVANRTSKELEQYIIDKDKLYTRDIFNIN